MFSDAVPPRKVTVCNARAGSGIFNGVHLRIEKDAEAWSQILGGRHVVEQRYRGAMRTARFDGNTPLYVASALLTYQGGPEQLQKVFGRTYPCRGEFSFQPGNAAACMRGPGPADHVMLPD